MDCDYKDDGGATAGLNVNNNLNSNTLFLKSSTSLFETNKNEQCLIAEESDAYELSNGIIEDKNTEKNSHGEISICTITNQLNGDLTVEDTLIEKNSPGEISLCTITNQINEDLAVGKDKSESKSSPEGISQSSMFNELSRAKEENLLGKESNANQLGKCKSFVSDPECLVVEQTDTSDNSCPSEVVDCIEKLAGSVETCMDTKESDEISETESIPSSEILEVLDKSMSEEEVYLEVDEQESDTGVEKQDDESAEDIDMKSHIICANVSNSSKTNNMVNENDIPMSSDISKRKTFDEKILESEVLEKVDDLCEEGSSGLKISEEKQDTSLIDKSSKIAHSLNSDADIPQIEFKTEVSSSISEQSQIEMKKKIFENESAMSEISKKSSDTKSLQSNSADHKSSSKNSTDIETNENVKTLKSNNSADRNSSKNSTDIKTDMTLDSNDAAEGNSTNPINRNTSENEKAVEFNILAEENSTTNASDMDISENPKTVESNNAAEVNSVTEPDSSEDAGTVESNIPAEETSSTNGTDMDISENIKTVEQNTATEGNCSNNVIDMEISDNGKSEKLYTADEGNCSNNVIDMEISDNRKSEKLYTADEGNCLKMAIDMETIENVKTVESDSAAERNSSKNTSVMDAIVEMNITVEESSLKNVTDIETVEDAKTLELDIAVEGKCLKNAPDVDVNESAKSAESNTAVEDSSLKNNTAMETIEHAKTLEIDTAAEGKSSTDSAVMEISENTMGVESNIAAQNCIKNATDMETNESAKTVESHIAAESNSLNNTTDIESVKGMELNIVVEENSLRNVADKKTSENAMSVESNIAVENCLKNATDTEINENAKTVESHITAEGNSSKNITDMENSEKSNEFDDFLVLSDIEWSDDDDDASDKQKTKVEPQNVENDKCVQSEKKCTKENESIKDTVNENPSTSSDGDDFDLDDVIEEFAKEEENKVVKISDDELDDLVEEFVEAECSSSPVEKSKESESRNVPLESDDELDLLVEDFKAVDSDNDCFIVQETDNVVVINDNDKDSQPKKKAKLNDSQSFTGLNSSDAISSSHNFNNTSEPVSNKVSKNDKTVAQEKDLNTEICTEKKTFEIGSFKSEIFDNKVEGNKQDNDSVVLEIINEGDSEGTQIKGSISILSALPVSERLPGKKVTLECRTDGVYLKKDKDTDNDAGSQGSNEKGKKESTDLRTDASNKLSVDRSVTTGTNLDSLEEEQCMDDMLSQVCSSKTSSSANNEECKSTADGKESKKINTFIQFEDIQTTSQNGEVKSLGSLCNDTLEESKKRKLEVVDNKSHEPQKKFKTEVNGVETDMDTSISHVDNSVRKRVLEHFKEAFPTKVQLKKSWLEKLSKRLCQDTILEEYQQKIDQQKNVIKNLEDRLQALEDELCYSQSQATTFLSVQQELFQKHHFTPQECDVAQPVPQPIPLPIVPKVEVPTHTTEIHGSTPVSSTPPIKVQVPQKIPIPVQQTIAPQTAAPTRFVSNSMQPRTIITSPQRYSSPNVTVMKKEVPVTTSSVPVRLRSYLAEKNQALNKTSKQVIDLTDEASSNKKLMPASSTLVSLASNSVPKVNLPGLQNNQNVLLPLNGLYQMLPASTPNNSQFSLSNPVQVQQVSRQAFIPTLQPNTLGPRTVAYIIPSNTGQMQTYGRNAVPVSNFVSGTNQRLQTLIVRVTNPGPAPPMSTAINSHARLPVPPQGVRTPITRNSPIPSSASDLVLFPRQPKHPAPFPALPEYRPNPQLKALPPKPSLKGSKAPNGIILSWNMNLLNLHAEISNYQLFAYQEGPGPVNASLWKKVGDVKALPLPMACTLTQFVDGNRYYFTVRAVDVHNRFGPYSDAVNIMFSDAKDKS
ncbi:unnamed protein product [Larinioides sclopetarius]|uniref:Fibronectin type-III domain-containing protein n=1 Tax=Larinioides sclopetarius TaxID=280406 RepID=A0AAV1YVC4_9ARAC